MNRIYSTRSVSLDGNLAGLRARRWADRRLLASVAPEVRLYVLEQPYGLVPWHTIADAPSDLGMRSLTVLVIISCMIHRDDHNHGPDISILSIPESFLKLTQHICGDFSDRRAIYRHRAPPMVRFSSRPQVNRVAAPS